MTLAIEPSPGLLRFPKHWTCWVTTIRGVLLLDMTTPLYVKTGRLGKEHWEAFGEGEKQRCVGRAGACNIWKEQSDRTWKEPVSVPSCTKRNCDRIQREKGRGQSQCMSLARSLASTIQTLRRQKRKKPTRLHFKPTTTPQGTRHS